MSMVADAVAPTAKRPAHRPSGYKPEFCAQVVELGKEGLSRVQIAGRLGVSKYTILDWERQHDEFSNAMHEAMSFSQVWWEDLGQSGVTAERFNANAYSLQVRNRFPKDWRDRQELTGANGGAIEVHHTHTIQIISDLSPAEREALRMIAERRVAEEPLTIEAQVVQE